MKTKKPQNPPKNENPSQEEQLAAAARKIELLFKLFLNKRLSVSEYERVYTRDKRSLQRDLKDLRDAGKPFGLQISNIEDGERVKLVAFKGQSAIDAATGVGRSLIQELAAALGGRVARGLGAEAAASDPNAFDHFLVPHLIETGEAGEVYDALKGAWAANAIVEFNFQGAKGQRTRRSVEPYRVIQRSGRDYLLAYDLEKKQWRTFGLDGIRAPISRKGTIQRPRTIPAPYNSNDVIGFMKSDGPTVAVTVALSPVVAASITARQWQAAQKVERLTGAGARITFEVTDVGEVVRWALGLGKEARIVAPDSAIELARTTLGEIAAVYEMPSS